MCCELHACGTDGLEDAMVAWIGSSGVELLRLCADSPQPSQMHRYLDGGLSEARAGTEWDQSVTRRRPPYSCHGRAKD